MLRSGSWLGVFLYLYLAGMAHAQSLAELQKNLQGLDAAVVVNDLRTGAFLRLNEPRIAQALPPFATFEIPVTLAALNMRVVRDLNAVTPWNQLKYPPSATDNWELSHWAEDQTLRSAFTHSIDWYWCETTERLGAARLQTALRKLSYGNQTLPDALTQCWQDDALLISAQQQTDFIKALAQGSLPFAETAQRNVKSLLLRESGNGYRFYLKTSVGLLQSGYYLGWSVGWLESPSGIYVFAINLTQRNLDAAQESVVVLPKRVLMATGYWPGASN